MFISIIIPTLNEEDQISRTIGAIHDNISNNSTFEIIVVDAGSNDATVSSLKGVDIQLEIQPSFAGLKYKSLNHGAAMSKGEVLIFLDADCIVPNNFDVLISEALSKPGVIGGAFEYRSENRSFGFKIIELINRMRYRMDGVYFGDQGIFCPKKIFDGVEGYPDEPIMEAAFLCSRLRTQGKLSLIKEPLQTSARRFERGGKWKVFYTDFKIWMGYLLSRNIRGYANDYWQENKKSQTE